MKKSINPSIWYLFLYFQWAILKQLWWHSERKILLKVSFFPLFCTVFPISFQLKQFEIHYMYSPWPLFLTIGVNFWTFIWCSRVSQSSAFHWYFFPEKQKHWIAKYLCLVSCQRTSGNFQDWKRTTDKATGQAIQTCLIHQSVVCARARSVLQGEPLFFV